MWPYNDKTGSDAKVGSLARAIGERIGSRTALLTILLLATLVATASIGWAMCTVGEAGTAPATAETSSQAHYIVVFNDLPPQQLASAEQAVTGIVESNHGSILCHYTIFPGLAVSVPGKAIVAISNVPGVKGINDDMPVYGQMDNASIQVGVRSAQDTPTWSVWDGTWGGNYPLDGTGVKICILDSGIMGTHPDLLNRDGTSKIYCWADAITNPDSIQAHVNEGSQCRDDNGHGTFIASEIAGNGIESTPYINLTGYYDANGHLMVGGPFKGIAPGASLMSVKVIGADDSSSMIPLLAGLNFLYENRFNATIRPDIISMSIAMGHADQLDQCIDKLIDAGFVVVACVGNDGPGYNSIMCPGDDPRVISVGAVCKNDTICDFSAEGPTGPVDSLAWSGLPEQKPDVVATGYNVIGARLYTTEDMSLHPDDRFLDYYRVLSGTSMATPIVSGVIALMDQYNIHDHGCKLTQDQAKYVLNLTARLPEGVTTWTPAYGNGVVDARAALLYLSDSQNYLPTPPPQPELTLRFDSNDYVVKENAGSFNVTVNATWGDWVRSPDAQVRVDYLGQSQSAIQGMDFNVTPGSLLFKYGDESTWAQNITVNLTDDHVPGPMKDFSVILSSTDPNAFIPQPIAGVTIQDTDYQLVRFNASSYTVANKDGQVDIEVTVDRNHVGANGGDISVNYTTVDGSGSAAAGKDYDPVASTTPLTFVSQSGVYPVTETKTIPVTIKNNPNAPGARYFTLELTDPTGAELGSPSMVTIWILPPVSAASADIVAPSTTYSLNPASPNGGYLDWYPSSVVVTMTATDTGSLFNSGVDYTSYWIDKGPVMKSYNSNPAQPLATQFMVGNIAGQNGTLTVFFQSVDRAGNMETGPQGTIKSFTLNIDKQSPILSIASRDPTQTTLDGWANKNVTYTIVAFDELTGVRGANSGTALQTIQRVTTEGYHQPVNATATDYVGNTITGTLDYVNIDKTPPIITCTMSPSLVQGWTNQNVTVSISADDKLGNLPGGSGVKQISYSFDNGATWIAYDRPFNVSKEGVTTILLQAMDNAGNVGLKTQRIGIDKTPPVITYQLTPSKPNNDGYYYGTVKVVFNATDTGSSGINGPTTWTDYLTSTHNSTSWTVTDYAGNPATCPVGPLNIKPSLTLGSITAPLVPVALGTTAANIAVNDTYKGGSGSLKNATWGWGDGTVSTPGAVSGNTITGTHKYNVTGVFTINLTLWDSANNMGYAEYKYIVVYDPTAGFVTGGGWINSLAGYYTPDTTLAGNANFGFDCKYTKNNPLPTGNTNFVLGPIQFQSTSNAWLVMTPPNAIYNGTGVINGAGNYGFLVSVNTTSPNRFRMEIWDKNTGVKVYDNQPGPENVNPTAAIGGGSIQLHKV